MAILDTGLYLAFTIILALSSATSAEDTECAHTQYVEIGTVGLIPCSCNASSFALIAWVNVNEGKTILLHPDGEKNGDGYKSGEYDMYNNGSLLIYNVTTRHESVFRLSTTISLMGSIVSEFICVHTIVKPAITIPVIGECSNTYGTICVKSTTDSVEVNCFVRDSRPAVKLSWTIRTHDGDHILQSNYMNFTTDNVTYTSHVTATFSFGESSSLILLVCRANSVPLNLVEDENVILIEKEIDYTSLATPIRRYLNIHSPMNLSCADLGLNLVIWKWSPQQDAFETLYVSILHKDNHTKISNKEYKLEDEGSLSLQNTLVEHEGLYSCVYDNGINGGIVLYDVLVMVDPTPVFLVIDGCNHQQYCVLEKQPKDVLTCSVLGIRPKVALEWRAFREETVIDFTRHQFTVTQMGDLYDISLTVNFDFTLTTKSKVTVECRAVGENAELFSLSTKIDLLFPNVLPTEQKLYTITTIIIAVLVTMMLMIIITAVVVIICRIRARKMKMKRNKRGDTENEDIPMLNNDSTKKAEHFIEQLKAKYEILYDSVKPIPYIKDRMFCVDKIFVEGGIEYMKGLSEEKAQWDKLLSYQELVTKKCLKTKRQILEGGPGYGKSTLALQLLYDWYKSTPKSPLKEVDVIIYLRLRQLGGVKSIFSAIRQFILPRDSNISEEDIKEILNQAKSVLVLLDGFDEYPDQESTETDIYHIMKKNIFQRFNVILTTRPSCVPQDIAPNADRVRLTGFGEEARRKYVEKAVIGKGGKAVDKIMRKLQKNPVLDDLCQVPLFFVMFADMKHETEQLVTLNSVTSFFRFMIASFHSHMRNKMKDDNVEKFQLINEHKDLYKIAFEALSGKNQNIVWDREQLRNQLGHEFYDRYIRIGLLVEEEILNIPDTFYPKSHNQYKTEVRFYHKLFCEWYAAHYVAEQLAGGQIYSIHNFLHNLDPFDLQYMYRFACGLNELAAGKIIHYSQNEIEGKKIAILCMLEQEDKTDRFIKTVSDLVSSSVTTINKDESKLLQRSTLQILDVASKKQVPISCLVLDKSLSKASDEGISLESGLYIPVLSTIKKIEIRSEKGTEFTNDQMLGVVSYAQRCHKLKILIFIDCLLPLSFSTKLLSSFMKSKHHQVMWQPSKHEFSLDISTGTWKLRNSQESLVLTVQDESSLPRLCSKPIILCLTDSRQVQSSSIVLLEVASSHNIPISDLCLKWSFSGFDGKDIRLESGLCLSSLSSVEKISINEGRKEHDFTEGAVIGLINYGIKSPRLKELWLDNCNLPSSIKPDIIPEESRSRNIKVISSRDACYLDLTSGKWSKPDDIQTITEMCSDGLVIHRDTSESVQSSVIELLVEASNQDIPIYQLNLIMSFSKIGEDGNIIIASGLSLPILTSIERMYIQTEKGREMNKHEVNGLLNYVQHSQRCKELDLADCLMLSSIHRPSLSALKSRDGVKVFWVPDSSKWDQQYFLDKKTGGWMKL